MVGPIMADRWMRVLISFCLFYGVLHCYPAVAGGYRVGLTKALMQQPTSQYYHEMNGFYADIFKATDSLTLRIQYLERPEFKAVGFRDKEYAGFVNLGTRVTPGSRYFISSFLGWGRFSGYIKQDATEEITDPGPHRSYKITGVSLSGYLNAQVSRVHLAIGVQSFTGFSSQSQLESYVGWPYNMILVNGGFQW